MGLSKEEKDKRIEQQRIDRYNAKHKEIDGVIYKICTKCNEWIICTDEYFYKNKSNTSDGLHPYCKVCCIKESTQWIKDNKEERAKYDAERYISMPLYFRKMSKNYYDNNVEKKAENAKRFRENNPERLKEYREKRRHKTHTITKSQWENCKKYFVYRCAYCGLPIEEHYVKYREKWIWSDFHKEHVEHNGSNDISNCIPSCKTCNSEKNVFKLEDWYNKDNKKYRDDRYNKIIQWLNIDHKQHLK